MTTLRQDIRYGFRTLVKSPRFALVAVLTLALGIGVNTSMFTTLQAALMRPLPYTDAGRLVRVFRTSPHSQSWPHSVPNFLDFRSQASAFEYMAAFTGTSYNLAEPGQTATRVRGLRVSADIFPLLRVQPQLGRAFSSDEQQQGKDSVAILSYSFWQHHFAGDADVLGRTIRLDGESVTVVGVMPEELDDPRLSGATEIWRPMVYTSDERQNRGWNWLDCVARLKRGVSLSQARAEIDALATRLGHAHPDTNAGDGARLVPLAKVGNDGGGRMMTLVMGLAGFVLLIACVNLANLQLARMAGRTRELGIRSALGANRRRLLAQLLAESLLVASLGGLLGLAVANLGNELLSRQIPRTDSGGLTLHLDLRVLGFALAATTISGLTFGLIPAWMASRANVAEGFKQGSRGTTSDRSQHRLRHALVICEVAMALVLLAGAGVVVRGLRQFASMDPGWQVDRLTLASISLPGQTYTGGEKKLAFVQNLQERLAELPGVERAAIGRDVPLRGFDIASSFSVEGRAEPPDGRSPMASINSITPAYFQTLGMRIIAGRGFAALDTADSVAVVIINETMARTFWPEESPIGRRIGNPGNWNEIIGVVNDVRFPTRLDEPETLFQTYRPFAQASDGHLTLALRGNVSVESVRQTVTALDPDLPVDNPGPARAAVERSLAGPGVVGKMLGSFAILGLFLAALGIYGVVANSVAQRTNEIGVRVALGAQVRDVLWLVIGRGLRLTMVGLAVGSVGAFGLARVLASVSPELKSNDPFTFVFVAGLLVLVAVLACWIPARRATRIDPMEALRCE